MNGIVPHFIFAPPQFTMQSYSGASGASQGKHMGTFFNFIAGAVLGGLIGGAAGAILAPKSGEDLRRQIRSEIDAILDEGRKAADDREHELRQQLAVLRGDEEK
jgi:uncharacterized membrane protein